jgi:putative flippase GtrA
MSMLLCDQQKCDRFAWSAPSSVAHGGGSPRERSGNATRALLDPMSDRSKDPFSALRSRDFANLPAMIRHLLSPRSGLLGQLVRFGMVGGLVTLFYLTVTTVLYKVAGLPFQLALAIGFAFSLLLHFTFQRLFVWVHYEGFALAFRGQVGRYLTMAGSQYGITVASTAVLPHALGVSTEIVYVATMAVVTAAGFMLMRFVIFHADAGTVDPSLEPLVDANRSEHVRVPERG